MGLTQTNVWIRRDTEFRGDLTAGEPHITIETDDYSADVSIFLGNASYAAEGVAGVSRQLDAFEAAIREARRLWELSLAQPADAAAGPTGPDDPDDEPTDEPVATIDPAGAWS